MAAAAGGNAGGITSGLIMGGFLCLGLFLLAIAATVVLSLIAIYTPSHAGPKYGDEYRHNSLLLKSLYMNSSSNFNNGSIQNNAVLDAACATQLKNAATNVAGCTIDNQRGSGPGNDSVTSRRRRRALNGVSYSGLYHIGRARVFFSTPCTNSADKLKYANSTGLSKCVSDRLAACNKLFNNTGTNLTEWSPINSLAYSIVESTMTSYVTISILKVFGIKPAVALSIASVLFPGTQIQSQISAGCQYIGPISQDNIATILAASSTATTTQPSSTNAASG